MIDKKYSIDEERLYQYWLENELFTSKKANFTMILPPPNVTGILHIGHVLNTTIQDVLIRWNKIKGFDTCWIPGLDHAGISTQQKVEQKLINEKRDISKLSKEALLEEAFAWKEKHGEIIYEQLKKLGLALDWDKSTFTLDAKPKIAVRAAFLKLYRDNLIYRGEYIINYSTGCKTAISDDEVEYRELKRKMWKIKYLMNDGYIVIATTRPETIFADAAIAVNPSDERYKSFIGESAYIPISGKEIKIIADDYVKMDFGTGALKVTPAHDINDFEIGQRHSLAMLNILDKDLKINIEGKYFGLSIDEARKAVVNDLYALDLIVSEEEIVSSVGYCSKSNTVIEPLLSTQWFVKMKPLAEKAIEAVRNGSIEFFPKHWEKTYFYWLDNIQDWCISRQLWWGHKIPIGKNGEILEEDDTRERLNEDVLDTWFSSWLWPFVLAGWPKKDSFEPTDVVVSGGDIIFFWIARMIMSSLYFTGKIPFKKVLLHGIVRDKDGKKMSKTLGNSPDPLELIQKYGADSLRFAVVYNTSLGSDLIFDEGSLELGRNFCNKIWNTNRFISISIENIRNIKENKKKEGKKVDTKGIQDCNLDKLDRWILGLLNKTTISVSKHIDAFELDIALKEIYSFFWTEFCDWYIEISKISMSEDRADILLFVFKESLKLLHPFMPFITESIWQNYEKDSIFLSSLEKLPSEYISLDVFKDICRFVRNVRAEFSLSKQELLEVSAKAALTQEEQVLIERMLNIRLRLVNELEKGIGTVRASENVEVSIFFNKDFSKELYKLEKELIRAEEDLSKVNKKLEDRAFLLKAPKHILDKEKRIQREYEDRVSLLKEKIDELK